MTAPVTRARLAELMAGEVMVNGLNTEPLAIYCLADAHLAAQASQQGAPPAAATGDYILVHCAACSRRVVTDHARAVTIYHDAPACHDVAPPVGTGVAAQEQASEREAKVAALVVAMERAIPFIGYQASVEDIREECYTALAALAPAPTTQEGG